MVLRKGTVMRTRVHAAAGVAGFCLILTFWVSTAVSELLASHETVAQVKTLIMWSMIALILALATTGITGMSMGRARTDAAALRKKARMPFIALNGLLVLVPSALFLEARANAGLFDACFYGVQAVELVAGAVNLSLMGLNIRDGLKMSGRLGRGARHRRA